MRAAFCALLVLFTAAVVTASYRNVEFDKQRPTPVGWSVVARAQPNHEQHVLIALKQRNLGMLQSIASAVSDPTHPSYGAYMTLPEINDLVAPESTAVDKVIAWMRSVGFYGISLTDSGDFVRGLIKVGDLQGRRHRMHTPAVLRRVSVRTLTVLRAARSCRPDRLYWRHCAFPGDGEASTAQRTPERKCKSERRHDAGCDQEAIPHSRKHCGPRCQ